MLTSDGLHFLHLTLNDGKHDLHILIFLGQNLEAIPCINQLQGRKGESLSLCKEPSRLFDGKLLNG